MKNYYYALEVVGEDEQETYVIITAVQFFEETGQCSDQGSEVFTDNKDISDFDDDDDLYWDSITDQDFDKFREEVAVLFDADQVCESMWQAKDHEGFMKYLANHPNFSTNEEFSALMTRVDLE